MFEHMRALLVRWVEIKINNEYVSMIPHYPTTNKYLVDKSKSRIKKHHQIPTT